MNEQANHLRVKVLFLFAAIFLIALSILSYARINSLIQTSAWLNHTKEVKSQLDHTYTQLVQAETSQRGFLHSKDASFLTDFFVAINNIEAHLSNVDSLTKDNIIQQRNIITLRASVYLRIDYLKAVLKEAEISGISPNRWLEGKALMVEVNNQIDKMQLEEDALMNKRTAIFSKETLLTPLVTFFLVLCAVIILLFTYFKIIKELKKSSILKTIIQERESRIQSIFDAAPDAVITIDEQGIITNWNAEAETLFGWKKADAIGRTLTETIIPERYQQLYESELQRNFKSDQGPILNNPVELYAHGKDKEEFPVELKISTSKLNDQSLVFIGFIRDITKRKQIESVLTNQTERLLEAQQLAHIGSWEWNVPENKIEWSDELYRIYGLSPQEFEADYENFLKYIHPDDREYVNGIVQQAFKDHQPFNFSHRLVCPDGTVRILNSTGKVTTDGNGNTIRMAGTAQDVTKQKEFELELQVSEERFIKIFDNNPVAMILSEIETNKIKYANHAFCALFGYAKEEVIGRTSEEMNLVAPEENARLVTVILSILQESRSLEELQALSAEEREELLVKLKQSDVMKDFEVEYTRKNGETFAALVSFEVIPFLTESFTVASYQDITERKKAQVQLQLQNEELEKVNKELESFTYISSHDLQEPLRQIQTFASRITDTEEKNLSERGRNYFDRMQNAANRMQTLISDLLAYSRASKAEYKLEKTDLNKIVQEVIEEFKETIDEKHAIIEVGNLGYVPIIPFQFRQLIHNLIANSLKFSKPELPPHIIIKNSSIKSHEAIGVTLASEKEYWHISIADNGIGFEPEYKEHIFEVFKRLHDKQKITGTGIGLAIVKKIVENHHGAITATGELNKGAIFDIYIPSA